MPTTSDIERFERLLLRRGVGVLTADRNRCADCGRTPLVGERVHLYDCGAIVCELCRSVRREVPVATETVRHSERGHGVRLTRAALAEPGTLAEWGIRAKRASPEPIRGGSLPASVDP